MTHTPPRGKLCWPSIRRLLGTSVIVAGLVGSIFATPIVSQAAGVPSIISYQGRLTDASGNLLGTSAGTTYYFKFSLWDGANVGSGNRLWPSSVPATTTASVRQGVFTVNIGDTTNGYPESLTYSFSSSTVYLQVEVSSNNSIWETPSPRQQITSAAFAQVAGAVSGTGQSAIGTTTPGNAVLTVEATSTTATPLLVRGILDQAADLLDVFSSAGASLFSISASGLASLTNLFVTGSSTLQAFTFTNATGTNMVLTAATTTTMFATTASSTNLFSTAAAFGSLSLTTALPVASGGTGSTTQQGALNTIAPTPTRAGDMIYYNGSNWVNVAGNNAGTNCLLEDANGVPSFGSCAGGGTVSSVSNSDGTLTISPNTGAVVASLALTHANWWTGRQNFTTATTSNFEATSTNVYFSGFTSALLGTDATGKLVATSSIGVNYLTGILGVGTGGTGASSFGQGWIYSSGGTTALAASTSPTVNYVVATSTTFASIFPYASTTAISGTTAFFTTSTSTTVNGNTGNIGTLAVTGTGTFGTATSTTLNGNTAAIGTLTVSGVGTFGTATSTAANANTGTFGTLSVNGLSTLKGGFVSQASSTVVGPLTATQASTTMFTNTGATYLTSPSTMSLLATDATGLVIASSTIGNSQLAHSTISGISLGATLGALTNDATLNGSSYTGAGAISDWGLNLANSNWWTATQNFTNASTSLFTATSSVWLTSIANRILAVDGSGLVAGTSTPTAANFFATSTLVAS